MIIVVAPSDPRIVQAARNRAFNFPAAFGEVYLMGQDNIPPLGAMEDLFFTGHALVDGASGNPEIGEENGDLAMDGLELWDNFRRIFPDMYQGSIYIDACETADHAWDSFSLLEQFKSQSDVGLGDVPVYGRTGSPDVGEPIPMPESPEWIRPGEGGEI